MKYAFGVDIGGTTVKMGLLDYEGNIEESWEIPTRTFCRISLLQSRLRSKKRDLTRRILQESE